MALALVAAACGPPALAPPRVPPPLALHLEPPCDLAPSAGLQWIVDARPRSIAEVPDLIPAILRVVSEARFTTFANTHGGVDVRQVQGLCIAKYKDALLTLARAPIDPARVEKAFQDRMTLPGGRNVDVANPPVVRVWGEVNGESQQLIVFGRELVALEQGATGPIRAAGAFAQNKLKRAAPALRSQTLARAVQLLGDAPLRVFAPGPFEGDVARGFGGLLRASTSVAGSATFVGAPARISIRIVLTGAWGKDAPEAAERLAAAAHVLSESPFGRLVGFDRPIAMPRVRTEADALILDATVDGMRVAEGLHDALDAEIGDIVRP